MALIDQIRVGQRFGEWTVLGFIMKRYRHQRFRVCACRCSCGTRKAVFASNLIYQYSTRCQKCGNKPKVVVKVGDRFGHRVVTRVNGRRCRWRCDCGRAGETRYVSLASTWTCRFCQVTKVKAFIFVGGYMLTVQDCRDLLGLSRQRIYQLRDAGRLRERLLATM